MRYIRLVIVLSFITCSSFSQSILPKFGVEVGASLKKMDDISGLKSPALSSHIGSYTLIPFQSDRFYAKFGAGLNFTNVIRGEIRGFWNETGFFPDSLSAPAINKLVSTLIVRAELRYNFFSGSPSWGNFYFSLPVIFESSPFTDSWFFRSEFSVIPSIGYLYHFNQHWAFEINSGIGWGKYFASNDVQKRIGRSSIFEYTSSLRFSYIF